LYKKGFRNIYLATGETINEKEVPSHIRGVIGREFPRKIANMLRENEASIKVQKDVEV